ncbi:hypothetical protein QFC19_007313 [Naganishia cerealis]|uniref:Uncharacterized protein n=1 Tax=Naganishia cerealis TaxID=610337 RepID=A0ACC2VAT9_9TREE|nr:hypothetical protein QFC19_007313 [Naganishia cerealis]
MFRLRRPPRTTPSPVLRIRHSSSRPTSSSNGTSSTWHHASNKTRASSSTASASSSASSSLSDTLALLREYLSLLRPSQVWTRYNVLLRSHPLKTRMVTSGALFVIGDMISQHIIEQRPFGPGVWSDEAHAMGKEERQAEGHVWIRTARLAFYGTIIFAPLSHNWLRLLERVQLHSKMSTVLAKVALDVSLWGAFIVGVFWTSNGILEGKSPSEIQDKVSAAYLPSWCKSILVFGPSQLFNFSVIPVPHRMLFSQCVGLGWNTFLSFANNRSNTMAAELAKRAVNRVERVEEGLEHAVERVEDGIVAGVMAVAHKTGAIGHAEAAPSPTATRTTPPAAASSSYIAPSPLESSNSTTASSDGTPDTTNPSHSHTAPTLQRYDEMLAEELSYQEALYPSMDEVPGCMTLFDEFLMCYGTFSIPSSSPRSSLTTLPYPSFAALGPQIRRVYRYGTPQPCTRQLEDFKYCMSLKGESEEGKRKLWIRRRAEWWAGRRVSASSEDVWDMRREKLVGFPPVIADDEGEGEQQMKESVA